MAKNAKKAAKDTKAMFGPAELASTINQLMSMLQASPAFQAQLFNIWRAGNALQPMVARRGTSVGLDVFRQGLASAYSGPLMAKLQSDLFQQAVGLGRQNVQDRMGYSQYLTNLYNEPPTWAKVLGGVAGAAAPPLSSMFMPKPKG